MSSLFVPEEEVVFFVVDWVVVVGVVVGIDVVVTVGVVADKVKTKWK